ncbi:MAG: LLM class flavin-dependent oxidoreductase, partial [Actinomycetota bacterium]
MSNHGPDDALEPMNELGFYTLAGAPESPRDLIDEVGQAEAMGIGSAFVSERLNIKEAATICGAVGAVSDRIGIATAATNHNTRHPAVTASHAMTMHTLTGGRFALGLGRGIDRASKARGLAPITTAQMEDFVGIMRRLWAGETILGHDGPAGRYPALAMRGAEPTHIPMTLVAATR